MFQITITNLNNKKHTYTYETFHQILAFLLLYDSIDSGTTIEIKIL